jgi:hypothetical protein
MKSIYTTIQQKNVMYCSTCGAEIKHEDAEICPSCGVRIKKEPAKTDKMGDKSCMWGCSQIIIAFLIVAGAGCLLIAFYGFSMKPLDLVSIAFMVILGLGCLGAAVVSYRRENC